jgi:hypothetical protein
MHSTHRKNCHTEGPSRNPRKIYCKAASEQLDVWSQTIDLRGRKVARASWIWPVIQCINKNTVIMKPVNRKFLSVSALKQIQMKLEVSGVRGANSEASPPISPFPISPFLISPWNWLARWNPHEPKHKYWNFHVSISPTSRDIADQFHHDLELWPWKYLAR